MEGGGPDFVGGDRGRERKEGRGGGGIVCSTENASVQDGSKAKVRKGSILYKYIFSVSIGN